MTSSTCARRPAIGRWCCMTRIAELVRGYLDYKHSLGYKVRTEGRTLMRFAEDMEEKGFDGP